MSTSGTPRNPDDGSQSSGDGKVVGLRGGQVPTDPKKGDLISGTGDGEGVGLNIRFAKLETSFEWMKLILAFIVTIMVGGFAVMFQQVNRLDANINRVDDKIGRLDDKITGLNKEVLAIPGKVESNLRDLTRTLSEAITAARQSPPAAAPIIINVPGPIDNGQKQPAAPN